MRRRALFVSAFALLASALPLLHGLGFMAGFNTRPDPELAARRTPDAALARGAWSGAAPAATAEPAVAGRVVVVIVDGLRADKVALLGLDGAVVGKGASAPRPLVRCGLETGIPSFSRPSYVALSAGVPPTLSGVHTNDHEGPAGLETIWELARRAGRETHLVTDGTDWWVDLFPTAFSKVDIVKKEGFARWFAASPAPAPGEVELLHIVAVDDDGHDFGALSPEYDARAREAGAIIRALAARLDLARDTLLVTADHGHIDRGGHGGPEPEVLHIALVGAGFGLAPLAPPTPLSDPPECHGRLLDLPATVGALLALPPPAASIGRPLPIVATPLAVPQPFAPKPAPPLRPPSFLGLALAIIGLALAFVGALVWAGRRGSHAGFTAAGALGWPLTAVIAYGLMEPVLSLSAVWLEDPWTLRMVAVLGVPALVLATIVFFKVFDDPWRALPAWSIAGLFPLAAAVGLHGSLSAGPELGEPHVAFGLIVADLIAAIGGAAGLLAAAARALTRRPRAATVTAP